jgi:NADH dehydrogenase FAD-containing subunit
LEHANPREVPFGLLVWSTGLAPNPLIESIDTIRKDGLRGSLVTDEYLNVQRNDGSIDKRVWAIGDAAMIDSNPLPATAQGEVVHGDWVAIVP